MSRGKWKSSSNEVVKELKEVLDETKKELKKDEVKHVEKEVNKTSDKVQESPKNNIVVHYNNGIPVYYKQIGDRLYPIKEGK